MYTIEADELGEAWLKAMEITMKNGEEICDDDRHLKEIRNLYILLENVKESDSILCQYADKKRIQLMKEKYSTCGLVGDYKIDYGSYIYNNNGINQMEWLRERILNKPETKSATITLHKPGEKMLACLSLLDFKYRNGKLDMNVVYRSQNLYASQPGNLIALRRIQEDLANAIGKPVGKIDLIVLSAHIYEENYSDVNQILKREEKL